MLHRFATLSLLAASLLFRPALSQSTFGSITGSVRDPSGAVVPHATVEVLYEETGAMNSVTPGSAGIFNVPNLGPGSYRVRVTSPGFSTTERTGLRLAANQILNIDVQLQVGATSNTVEVRGATPTITTEASNIAGRVDAEALQSLPLVGRHDGGSGGVYTYLTMTTGAAAVPSSATPVVQGARSQVGMLPTMDGIAVMAYPQGAGPVQPSMDGIEEITIQTSVAPAEFSTSSSMQVVTKGGGNQFHGNLFWDYNGNKLNARNFFSAAAPFRVYNNFGASGGGPIRKNKLFFFGAYEGSRESATTTLTESVPTPAWRSGIFSQGVPRQLMDPISKLPFPGNVIPADRISKVAQAIQDYAYPLPNTGAPGAIANNWTANRATKGFTNFNSVDGRVDYNPTNTDAMFARVSWRKLPAVVPGIDPLYRLQNRYGESGVFAWNHTIAPTAFNEFRFGSTYHRNFYTANVVGSDLLRQFGIQGISTQGVKAAPYFNITGVTPWNPGAQSVTYNDNPEATYEWIDNLSWNRGRHAMKFGFNLIRDVFNGNSIGSDAYGQYDFSGVYTGFGYADFLLGIPQTTSVTVPSPNRHLRGTTMGIYAQDQFKVSSRLTLNLGLRWELAQPYTDTKGALYAYSPEVNALVVPDTGASIVNPLFPKSIPVVTASKAGYPKNLVSFRKNNIEPRVGFAYKMFGSDKTVLRGGYGIYPNLIYATLARNHLTGGPFAGSATYNNSIGPNGPLFAFPSPVLASGSVATQNVNALNPNIRTPYTQQWNMTLERQIGSMGLRASYVGSRTIDLLYRRNLNQPEPSTTPFTVTRRPNQGYNQIIYADNGGTDAYHALELAGQKRYGGNLTFSAGFTWAKDLTDTQDASGGGTTYAGQVIQNPLDRAVEKANNQLVVPRRAFAYADWALPVGHGQRFLSKAPAMVQAALGGWRTTWAVVSQSGQYFTPTFSGFDPSGTGTNGGVPDRIGNGNLDGSARSLQHWFDPAAFAVPGCPATTPLCTPARPLGRFGNSGYNILAGPAIRNLDFALLKEWRLFEKYNLRFHMTMADALNHPNFSNPALNISAPATVGVISSTTRPQLSEPAQREIDFGLRIRF